MLKSQDFLPRQGGGRGDGPSGPAGEAGGGGARQKPADVPAETRAPPQEVASLRPERSRKGSSFPNVEQKSEYMFRPR